MAVQLPPKSVEMLRIYRLKMFTSYCFSIEISGSLYQMGWQFSCHLITGRNFKDLLPDIVLTPIVLVR